MKLIISDKVAYEKDSGTQKVVKYLKDHLSERKNCICYYQYPLYRTEFGFVPSLVLLDSEFGVVIFKILNYSSEHLQKISENYWLIDGKKERSPLLDIEEYSYSLRTDVFRPKFRLDGKINISSFIILPFVKKTPNIVESTYKAENILFEDYESGNIFDSIAKKTIEKKEWKSLLNIIQRLEPLSKSIGFAVEEPPKTIGDAIILNEQKICTFDDDQETAAIKIINGGMRIRGLAGTGKTIILTWKAAYIHFKYPDAKIVYTFYTKSLYNQIKRLITQFYKKYNPDEEPNWDNLNVLHAWGGTGKQGLYYNTCQRNKIPFMSMRGLRFTKNPFGVVLNHLLKYKINEEYDFVLVDEAQDMPLEFFSLIKRLTKSPKRITIAYDELQNTEDIQMPDFEKLFGNDAANKPIVPLEEDIILQKSYRNHIKVLHLAVALGFGIYSKHGIIQIIENNENWKAIGYQIRKGELKPNIDVEIERPAENSPNNIEEIYPKLHPVTIKEFEDKDTERKFVAKQIINLVKKHHVKPEDIIVINLDSRNVGSDYQTVRQILYSEEIDSKTPGLIDEADDFFVPNNVTLSTIRRAKGNEAPIVFVMGINKAGEPFDNVQMRINRNFAFVSITRAKGWCFITGCGGYMKNFMHEFNLVKDNFPVFKFKFPSEARLKEIYRVNYITKDEKSKREYFDSVSAAKTLIKLDQRYLPEDLKKKLRERLKRSK